MTIPSTVPETIDHVAASTGIAPRELYIHVTAFHGVHPDDPDFTGEAWRAANCHVAVCVEAMAAEQGVRLPVPV